MTAQAANLTATAWSLAITASPQAIPGSGTVSCALPGYSLGSQPLTVKDASPFIGYVQQYPPATQGGPFYVTLWGSNFGPTQGTIGLCAVGATPCNGTPDLSYSLSAQYSTWTDTQINFLLTPSPTAGGIYDVVVNSLGENGVQFFAQTGANPTSSQSNRGKANVPRVSPPTVQISRGTAVVSGSAQTVVSVGEFIDLNGTVANLPNGVTVTSQSWTVQGNRVANYVQTVQSATVTPFSDPGTSEVKFYWIDAATNSVTYAATLSDQTQVSATAAFLVVRPSPVSLTGTTTTGVPAINVSDQQVWPNGVLGLNFGYANNNGITFNMSESSGVGGQFALVQLLNFNTNYTIVGGGSQQHTSATFILDDGRTGVPQYSGAGNQVI